MAPTAVETKKYDYIVIGGGSGGSAGARRAAGWYGAKTVLIENGLSGGCCVNVGCVPKKMTWLFADVNERLRDSVHYGYKTPTNIPFDFSEFKQKRDAVIRGLNAAYERNWAKEGIELIHGTASFSGPKEIEVALQDGTGTIRYQAPHILIATGGSPIIPEGLKGAEHGITNEGFFAMDVLPKKVAVIGAGYIAVELAGVYNAMGVETHLYIRGKTFLRTFDTMVQDVMTQHYEDAGVIIHKEHSGFQEIELVEDGVGAEKVLRVHGRDGEVAEFNDLLWAIGRKPETQTLGLDKVGVKTNDKGYILADDYQNTSAEGIYALGDVTGQLELTPVAIAAGRQLGNRLFGPPHLSQSKLSYNNVPTVVFAHPEVGTVGLTEAAARTEFGASAIKTYQSSFSAMYYDVFPAEERKKQPTVYKLICAGDEEKVVGLHIVGLHSAEILQGFGVAIKMGATKRDFEACVAIHPTSAEEIVTIK